MSLFQLLLTLTIHHRCFVFLLSGKVHGNLTGRPPLFTSHSLASSTSCLLKKPKRSRLRLTVFSFRILDSLALGPERQLRPIIRGESHTADIHSKVQQILGNWKSCWETYCATLPLIFCQVSPGLRERCRAAGTDLQFDHRCRRGHKKTIYCSNRGQKSTGNTKNSSMAGIYSPQPRSAQFWQSVEVDYFQAWQ